MQQFYKVDKLKLKDKIAICNDAKDRSYSWWVDKLDCNISWSRQKIEMPFEEIMAKLNDVAHFSIIQREDYFDKTAYLEIGFCTMGSPEYFLWIECRIKELKYFVEKYKLEKHE